MRAETLARLRSIARGDPLAKPPVTRVTPVTPRVSPVTESLTGAHGGGAMSRQGEAPPVTPYRELQGQAIEVTCVTGVTGQNHREEENNHPFPAMSDFEPDADAVEERAGLAADSVPSVYLDAWSRLNHQKPFGVSEADWRLALDDGGQFLDSWGDDAAALGWTPGDLFNLTAGLVWRRAGVQVQTLTLDQARLADGRTHQRGKGSMMAVRRLGNGGD